MESTRNKRAAGSTASTILAIIVSIVMAPLLIVNVTIIVQSFVSPEKVPGFFGYKPLIVLSGSMEPTILAGDLVIVRETPADALIEGDIIAFAQGSSVVTHRVMKIDSSGMGRLFYTKGDNNNADDRSPVTDNMLEGRFLFRIPRMGHAAMFMQTPTGIVLFVALPLVLFVLADFLRVRRYAKTKDGDTRKLEEQLAAMQEELNRAQAAASEQNEEKNS